MTAAARGVKPPVIALVGDTRRRQDFDQAALELEMAGWVVLMPGVWADDLDRGYGKPEQEWQRDGVEEALREITLRKVEIADSVLVVARDQWTPTIVAHARRLHKTVTALDGDAC